MMLFKQGYTMSQPDVGEIVAAPFEGDQSWYRAKVMGIEGDNVDLYYLDYGDSGYLPYNQIRKLRYSGYNERKQVLCLPLHEVAHLMFSVMFRFFEFLT